MARKVGMRVEGLRHWVRQTDLLLGAQRGEVEPLPWLPFGGYVRIVGHGEAREPRAPHGSPTAFLAGPLGRGSKSPQRGPLVNIVFAFIAFCLIWASGEKVSKSFSEHTLSDRLGGPPLCVL